MHKIKVVGVRTLESGKFDPDKAEWGNPPKATIKWPEKTELAEAAQYNNRDAVIMSEDEYQTLKEGFKGSISPEMRKRIKDALMSVVTVMDEDERITGE